MSANLPDTVIAVFEASPYWGPELQRQFEHTSVVIRECRTVDDLLPTVRGFNSALLVLDLDSGLVDCLAWLGSDVRHHPLRWPIIACGSATNTELEWLLREAGVTGFLLDMTNGDEFARLCRRQLGLQLPGKTAL